MEINFKDKPHQDTIGIYAICADDKVIYIGKTETNFLARQAQHVEAFNSTLKKPKLYDIIKKYKDEGCEIYFKELISVEDIYTNYLTRRDLEAMELGLITLYQPEGNIEGISKKYALH